MAAIVFAAVVATVLFFFFERTRGFGVMGVFALIAIQPLFFTAFFLTLALIYFYATYKWRNRHAK